MATRGSNASEAVDGRSFLGINQFNLFMHAYSSTCCAGAPSRREPNKRDAFGCWFVTICGWKHELRKPSPVGEGGPLAVDEAVKNALNPHVPSVLILRLLH